MMNPRKLQINPKEKDGYAVIKVGLNPHTSDVGKVDRMCYSIEEVMFKVLSSNKKGGMICQTRGPFLNRDSGIVTVIMLINQSFESYPTYYKSSIDYCFRCIEQLVDLMVSKYEKKMGCSIDQVIQVQE